VRRWRVALVALTLSFVCLGSVLAFLMPMFANYDEQTHLDRVELTADDPHLDVNAKLDRSYGSWAALQTVTDAMNHTTAGPGEAPPSRPDYLPFRSYPGGDAQQHEACPGGLCQNYQYTQPPLWYYAMTPITAALRSQPFPRTIVVLRVLAVITVATMIPLAWWTARQVWPREERRPLAVAALTATFGPLAFMAAGVNNDGLMLAIFAVLIALMTATLCTGTTVLRCVGLGAALAIGLLTKVEVVVVAPVVLAAIWFGPRAQLARWKALAITLGLALPGLVWWVSEQLGGGVLSPSDSQILKPPGPGPWRSSNLVTYSLQKAPMLFDRFWGLYGVPPFVVPPAWRVALWAATALLAASLFLWGRSAGRRRWRLWVLAAVPIALVASVMYASFKTYHLNGEIRGLTPRYLYPALSLFAIAAVAALSALAARARSPRQLYRWGLPMVIVGGALLGGLGTVALVLHGLYDTSSASAIATRAALVSPTSHPVGIAGAVTLLWIACLAVAVWATATTEAPEAQSSTTWDRNDSRDDDHPTASNVPSGRSASAAARPITSA
jgi:hypothetical protein